MLFRSEYWNEIKAYFYNTDFLVGKLQELCRGEPPPATLAKAAGTATISGGATVNSYMLSQLIQKAKQTDLVTAIASILATVANSNLFYKLAFDRLRIPDRMRVRTSGQLIALMGKINIDEFLAGFTGREGGFVSIRQMLMNVMALVYQIGRAHV